MAPEIPKPMRFENGTLWILDQRQLPGREDWLECRRAEEVVHAIKVLAVRGAPAIGLAAAYGVVLAAYNGQDLDAAAETLKKARPTAVNLSSVLEEMVAWARAGHRDGTQLLRWTERLLARYEASERAIQTLGSSLVAGGSRVLTHCHTGSLATGAYGTALGILTWAARDRNLEVWVDETRPLWQGARLTAWELGRHGIAYRIVTDGAAGSLLQRGLVDLCLVGADRVAANGDVANKIGTYTLAVLASRHRVPFYVAAPFSTVDMDCPSGADVPIEQRSEEEVLRPYGLDLAPPGARAYNPAFDVTPHELITGIVTDRGLVQAPYDQQLAATAKKGIAS